MDIIEIYSIYYYKFVNVSVSMFNFRIQIIYLDIGAVDKWLNLLGIECIKKIKYYLERSIDKWLNLSGNGCIKKLKHYLEL